MHHLWREAGRNGMALWIGFAVLSAAVLVAVLRPLWAVMPAVSATDSTSVYRDQLTEIELERERGLLADAEAAAARAEVARRLLASAAETEARAMHAAPVSRHGLVGALAIALPLVVSIVYFAVGSPLLPDQPLHARSDVSPRAAEIAALIEKVEARLRAEPADGRGWDVIAPVYLRRGDYAKAAIAFRRAMQLLGETPFRLAGFAEATVLANEGTVTEPARAAYQKLSETAPTQIEPRFWLAVHSEQAGRLDEAEGAYRALSAEPGLEASWRPLLEERLRAIAAARRDQGPSQTSPSRDAPPQPAARPERGPSTADVAAAEQMSPDDRQRMIEGMVQSLADRLKADGRDLAGWQRLIRAYVVLGRQDAARDALKAARSALSDDPPSIVVLTELARSLGLDT
jgi:cytochrome c-type biogenesis protein CcmH